MKGKQGETLEGYGKDKGYCLPFQEVLCYVILSYVR
jgi:hypothetical protein